MHPLFLLPMVTFVLIGGFLVWNFISTRRHRFSRSVSGIGGENDPLSGKTEGLRSPDEMRAALDAAAGFPVRSLDASNHKPTF
jgi:hypothetical protein